MTAINTALANLFIGAPQTHRALTIFPLLQSEAREPSYITLDEALSRGSATVSEVSEAGSVPELKFVNLGDDPVLLLDGEELVGAKQNRVLNMSIMAAGKSEIVIPVSCVEAGRWRFRSRDFKSAGRVQFSRGRAKKTASVNAFLRRSGIARSDQSEVWKEIADKGRRMASSSETEAMESLYVDYDLKLAEYQKALPAVQSQVGAVYFINSKVVGLDLFDCAAIFAKQQSKLLKSYALDAIEVEGETGDTPSPQDAADWLEAIKLAAKERLPAVGLGINTRIDDKNMVGAALEVGNEPVHVYAAPVMA